VFNSFSKLCRVLCLLCLASPVFAQEAEAWIDLGSRVSSLEERMDGLELKLEVFTDWGVQPRKFRSKEELSRVLELDDTGEAQRKDKLVSFPEISTFVAWSYGRRSMVNGLGVELFHNRNEPRRHKWMFKLLLGDEWVGFSVGYILVPVINFNVGPFIAKDLEEDPITREKETVWGVQASVFSF